jgi:hypothetical protein
MASGLKSGIKGKLKQHLKNKADLWTHFSLYEVWDNITKDEVSELEGLFRNIYKKDSKANRLNQQKTFKKFRKVKLFKMDKWEKVEQKVK